MTQETPGLCPNWFKETNLLLVKGEYFITIETLKKFAANYKLRNRSIFLDTGYILSCEQVQHELFSNQKEIFPPLENH